MHAEQPKVDPATKSVLDESLESPATCLSSSLASQPLYLNVLRRPVESAQYTSLTYGRRIREAGLVQSMGSRGDCFDNAMAESFFATLECELLDRQTFHTRAQARMEVFDFIEGYYNTQRRHSSLSLPGLGMQSPAKFELQWLKAREAERVTK